jgi:very-short-patch-repair endonuclease
MTDAELRLWMRLSRKQIDGHAFRRQVPIGTYVVDFVCLKRRLVIEVDGSQHATEREEDDRRTAWLESRGFRVMRFWNNEVLQNLDGVTEAIRAAMRNEPPPRPSPQGGGRFMS